MARLRLLQVVSSRRSRRVDRQAEELGLTAGPCFVWSRYSKCKRPAIVMAFQWSCASQEPCFTTGDLFGQRYGLAGVCPRMISSVRNLNVPRSVLKALVPICRS